MSNQIEIKIQEDLDEHLRWHEKEVEKIYDAKRMLLDKCDSVLTQQEIDSLNYLDELQEKLRTDSYPLELEDNYKITMYVNHEGSCMSNIQYCPWCGIHFIITQESKSDP